MWAQIAIKKDLKKHIVNRPHSGNEIVFGINYDKENSSLYKCYGASPVVGASESNMLQLWNTVRDIGHMSTLGYGILH